MAGQESKQKYLGRNRPPRVQITYDVEIGNAFETTELPLVVGIFSDLSGNVPETSRPGLEKRGFVDIDRDSFDTVLSKINPQLQFSVPSLIEGDAGTLPITLSFKAIEDFSPEKIVGQVEGLKELYIKRQRLQDLLIKLDGNAALDSSITANLKGDDTIKIFQQQLKLAVDAATPKKAAGEAVDLGPEPPNPAQDIDTPTPTPQA